MKKEYVHPEVDYEEALIEELRERPEQCAYYLNACLDAGDTRVFLLALRQVTRALGGMSRVAELSGLNRESLYRMLSRRGNPELNGLIRLLKALKLRLAIVPASSRRRRTSARRP